MVRLSLTVVAHHAQVKQLAGELRALMTQARADQGLMDGQLSVDIVDPCRLYYVEEALRHPR